MEVQVNRLSGSGIPFPTPLTGDIELLDRDGGGLVVRVVLPNIAP